MYDQPRSGDEKRFTFCFDTEMDADIIALIERYKKGKRSRLARLAFRSYLDTLKSKSVRNESIIRSEGLRIVKKDES